MQICAGAKIVSVSLIAVLTLGACATPQGGGGSVAQNDSAECNAGGAALVGALLGAAVARGNNRVRGAALGAGLASLACAAVNYSARQTKSATQVQQEYRTANNGTLPDLNRVTRYETAMDGGGRIRPGGQLSVLSTIEVVQGKNDRPPVLEEEIVLRRPDGKDVRSRKRATENGGGAFNTSYTMKMPEGVQQGEYPVQMSLYMNGQAVATRTMAMQVVQAPGGAMLASIR